jgi:hypothetical protein
MKLRRFWVEFNLSGLKDIPAGIRLGCGVTALSTDEALNLIRDSVFEGNVLPPISRCVEDIDIRSLDQAHVVPNMGVPSRRGIWFPLGYA